MYEQLNGSRRERYFNISLEYNFLNVIMETYTEAILGYWQIYHITF